MSFHFMASRMPTTDGWSLHAYSLLHVREYRAGKLIKTSEGEEERKHPVLVMVFI